MFYLGYAFGCITCGLFLSLGYLSRAYLLREWTEAPGAVLPMLTKRNVKRKPKAVSDAEQWKREQTEPPLDPGL